MEENIYSTPKSDLVNKELIEDEVASRGERLGASMLDGILIMMFTFPAMYFTGGLEGVSEGVQPSIGYSLLMGLAAIVFFFLVNGRLLISKGQTLGKKLVGIKIVTLDGSIPSIGGNLVKRYAMYFLPGQIPAVGQLISIINILFIFGKEKRCLHDYVAGTRVVKHK